MASQFENSNNLEPSLRQHGVTVSPDTFVRDWTKAYEFFVAERLLWIVDAASGQSAVAVTFGNDEWKILNKPANLAALNDGLQEYPLVEDAHQEIFFSALVALLYDPRHTACGTRLAGYDDTVLNTYVLPGGPGIDKLRDLCGQQPSFESDGDRWNATMRVLDFAGAIRDFKITGRSNPLAVESFTEETVVPEGNFNYPEEF